MIRFCHGWLSFETGDWVLRWTAALRDASLTWETELRDITELRELIAELRDGLPS